MSSSRRSGSVSWNSLRQPAWLRDTCCAAGPVCQRLSNQTQSKPSSGKTVELSVRYVVQHRRATDERRTARSATRAC